MAASAKAVFTIYRHGAPHTSTNALDQVVWSIFCDGERVTLDDRTKQMEADLRKDHAQLGDLVFTRYTKQEVQMS